MTTEISRTQPYRAHRANQRERILAAAEHLFIERGIDGVSISDIARAARLTRNTVYEYFPSKQEAAWAILQKIVREALSASTELPQGTGLRRLEHLLFERIREVETHPQRLRFILEFNTLYAREAADADADADADTAARMRQLGAPEPGQPPDRIAELVRQGMADGSLRPDLDPALVSAALRNLLSGMNARFALLGALIPLEFGQPVMAIYQEICRAFLRGIQSLSSLEQTDAETKI